MKNKLNNRKVSPGPPMYGLACLVMLTLATGCAPEKKERKVEELKITKELANLLRPTDAVIVSEVRTIMPTRRNEGGSSEAKGRLTYDTRRAAIIPIRYSGRIEKLFIKFNLQPVRKGQTILEIYSPDLVTAQKELLYLLKSDPENKELIASSKRKLILLGISETQLNGLVSARTEVYSFPIISPVDGYVIEESKPTNDVAPLKQPSEKSMNGGMADGPKTDETGTQPISNAQIRIREGMYVTSGESILKIVESSQLRAEFDLYQSENQVKVNDPLEIYFDNTSLPSIHSRVDFVQPFLNEGENFIKVRVYINNPSRKYEVGQLVTAHFHGVNQRRLWVPKTAVMNLGTQEIVFVKKKGVFRPRLVKTGWHADQLTELLDGVDERDSLAYQAQYMVDSESFIKVNQRQ